MGSPACRWTSPGTTLSSFRKCRLASPALGQRLVVATLAFASALCAGQRARADSDVPVEPRLFLRLAVGAAFNYESWSPSGGSPGASYTG
jgi:hypothetical protein